MDDKPDTSPDKPTWVDQIKPIAKFVLAGLLAVAVLTIFTSGRDTEPAAADVGIVKIHDYLDACADSTETCQVKAAIVDSEKVTLTLDDDSKVMSRYPLFGGDTIVEAIVDAKIADTEVHGPASPGTLVSLLTAFGPILLIVAVMFILVRRVGGGQLAGLNNKNAPVESPNVKFSDVIGADEAVEDLSEIVDFLRRPDHYRASGARVPKGVLLVGPPGTGKTLIAKAVATEAGVPFFSAVGSDFVEVFAGLGQKRVKSLFAAARKHGRAVIFIDEIDSVGRARGGGGPRSGASDEHENTLNALLTEMDGFVESNVIVMGATNRPELLDSALTRAGRFDRRVTVALPDRGGRARLLKHYLRDVELAPGTDVDRVVDSYARRTVGMSGADIANLINEAKLIAIKRGTDDIRVDELSLRGALERIAMGPARKSAIVSDAERRIVAYHEAGHAAAAMMSPNADDPMHVSIVPRGPAGGVTWLDLGEAEHFHTRSRMLARLVIAMGGRAAEKVILDGDYTQGASGDIMSATQMATQMVCQYGMSELGPVAIDPNQLLGEDAITVRRAVQNLIEGAAEEADAIMADHWNLVSGIAEALLEHEDLTREQLREIAVTVGAREAGEIADDHEPHGFQAVAAEEAGDD